MFLPTTKQEIKKLSWDKPDVILVSGDVYIDSPFMGVSIIGSMLVANGFKTAIISQPDIKTDDIARLGEPRLFWGVTAGCMDSFVSNWTALNKFRNDDDLTPGGKNIRRPNRACMVYANLIRRFFKNTKPIVLGGLEASLRRISHYDFQDSAIRRSILFDSKSDILIYGMGEKTVVELAKTLDAGDDWKNIKGLCYISKEKKENSIEIPSFEECSDSKDVFFNAFKTFYQNSVSNNEKVLIQKHKDRYLVQNPHQDALTQKELDEIYDMDFTREVHPYYLALGEVRAQETIKFSITTHRGCFGECNFCSIAVHQRRQIVSRSSKSIVKEAQKIASMPDFKGYISDLGGPSANMFGAECKINKITGSCADKRCLFPEICPNLIFGHQKQIDLLNAVSKIASIKKVFISSGIRYDLVCGDKENAKQYLEKVIRDHTNGQMKIAPEHSDKKVLSLMGKTSSASLIDFVYKFNNISKKDGDKKFLTYYFMVAYPGCDLKEMKDFKNFINKNLKISPQQVQIFTPLPSTWGAAMYFSERNIAGDKIFVEKDRNKKQEQKRLIIGNTKKSF